MHSFLRDAKVITDSLSFTGSPIVNLWSSGRTAKSRILRTSLMYILAFFYVIGSFPTVYIRTTDFFTANGKFLQGANVGLQLIFSILLRIITISKAKKLAEVLHYFSYFIKLHKLPLVSLRMYIIGTCAVAILVPQAMSLVFLTYSDHNMQHLRVSMGLEANWWADTGIALAQVAYSVNEHTFPCLSTVFLGFLYLSYIRIFLQTFIRQIKSTLKRRTSANIKKCLDAYFEADDMRRQIEDLVSATAFLIYCISFTSLLYLIYKYVLVSKATATVLMQMRAVLCVLQMTVLCTCSSKAAATWDEIRHLAQQLVPVRKGVYGDISNQDLLNLMFLMEGTSRELPFTCMGILKLNLNLLVTTAGVLVTFSAFMF